MFLNVYLEETGTVFHRNGNSILKKRETYCAEILSKEKEMRKGIKSKQPDITFAPKGICQKATP